MKREESQLFDTSGSLRNFGEYAALRILELNADLKGRVSMDTLALAANAYLYRFDRELALSFVRDLLQRAAALVADASGRSPEESSRFLRRRFRVATREYFSRSWSNLPELIAPNTCALTALRQQHAQKRDVADQIDSAPAAVIPVSQVSLGSLVDGGHNVVVKVYADYCSRCAEIAPLFEEAAKRSAEYAVFASLNGPRHLAAKERLNVQSYPSLLRLRRGLDPQRFPSNADHSVENYVRFARGEEVAETEIEIHIEQMEAKNLENPPRIYSVAHDRLGQWAMMLERQGIDELDALVRDRDIVVQMRIDEAIRCGGESCNVLPPRSFDICPPLCILLGGGMGSGKTTAVSAISSTAFWKEHGQNVVCVEADAFKQCDPFFHVLRGITPTASKVVHADSIAAAEELFLQAVNTRRDVVFDGTLSWCEYARQTVAMLRDTNYIYARGKGYEVGDDGTVVQEYWKPVEKREKPVPPYHVELVGVTIDPCSAVTRGIVRKILTGRGVPIPGQLQSHLLFSQHFEEYVELMDAIYLFDMAHEGDEREIQAESHEMCSRSSTAEIIAMKSGLLFSNTNASDNRALPPKFQVHNTEAYENFKRKMWLNTNATSAADVFLEDNMKSLKV